MIRSFGCVIPVGGPVSTRRERISPYLGPETKDRVLFFTQYCPREYKGPENGGFGVIRSFGYVGVL